MDLMTKDRFCYVKGEYKKHAERHKGKAWIELWTHRKQAYLALVCKLFGVGVNI